MIRCRNDQEQRFHNPQFCIMPLRRYNVLITLYKVLIRYKRKKNVSIIRSGLSRMTIVRTMRQRDNYARRKMRFMNIDRFCLATHSAVDAVRLVSLLCPDNEPILIARILPLPIAKLVTGITLRSRSTVSRLARFPWTSGSTTKSHAILAESSECARGRSRQVE